MRQLIRLLIDRSGAAVAEYALVFAILGAAVTFGALALGTAVTDSVEEPVECTAASTGAEC
ncbi:MAG TPA: Flp family type IVb pilin [Sphingomicrobium sp.]|nr:Flp family type IVb pilin [Sphingomicrobium sp.]